eukprot:scaffold56361_cov60-Phaeocystis_antarctica.AAC.2
MMAPCDYSVLLLLQSAFQQCPAASLPLRPPRAVNTVHKCGGGRAYERPGAPCGTPLSWPWGWLQPLVGPAQWP